MEQQHIAILSSSAAQWADAIPAGLADLRHRYIGVAETLGSRLLQLVRTWDMSHEATVQAWQVHFAHLQEASRAILEERTPPDVWLSEVQYRERARNSLSARADAELELQKLAESVAKLEVERSELWAKFAAAYSQAHEVDCARGEAAAAEGPPAVIPAPCQAAPLSTSLPPIPSTAGAVLHHCRVAVPAQSGFFGRGGGGWQEGYTLVLTMHGYMHLFGPKTVNQTASNSNSSSANPAATGDPPPPEAPAQPIDGATAEAVPQQEEEEEFEVAAIQATVYVPMATRCLFLRKGKDRTLDLAEAEGLEQPEKVGLGQGLRNLIRKQSDAAPKPVLRRINAKVADEAALTALETRCHEFVRRGQSLRAFAAAAKAATAPA